MSKRRLWWKKKDGEMSVDEFRRCCTESSRENAESRETEGAVQQNHSCVFNDERERVEVYM